MILGYKYFLSIGSRYRDLSDFLNNFNNYAWFRVLRVKMLEKEDLPYGVY